jgi:hypothetical protein
MQAAEAGHVGTLIAVAQDQIYTDSHLLRLVQFRHKEG